MKKLICVFSILIFSFAFSQKAPDINKIEFTPDAVSQRIMDINGNELPISDIIAKHKGKVLVIDFWASWCQDCLKALPKTKELVANNANVDFVYFSLDRNFDAWKKGLEKHGLEKKENYFFSAGWKNKFNDYVELNWIPRLMVISQNGYIAKYYATTPEDPEIQKTIDKLTNL